MLETPEHIISFYREAYVNHGATPQGMRWHDEGTHWYRLNRIRELLKALDISPYRVLDVGCGIGLLYRTWDLDTIHSHYHGVELVPEYVAEAQKVVASNPNAIVTQDDFMQWGTVDLFGVTVAVGVFAWQPADIARQMLVKMWELTHPGGAMAFTFIPETPLSKFEINGLGKQLGAAETLIHTGYSDRLNEHIVIFTKADWPGESSYPYKHEEEIADEVMRGEYREEEYASEV